MLVFTNQKYKFREAVHIMRTFFKPILKMYGSVTSLNKIPNTEQNVHQNYCVLLI